METEILERIGKLNIDCPDCECYLDSDEQYQCGICGGSGQINVLDYLKQMFDLKFDTNKFKI
jgi:hypothetical protein